MLSCSLWRANVCSATTGVIALCLMALTLAFLASLVRVDFLVRKGFALRTLRTPRLGEGIAEMFLCYMGILTTNGHEFSRMGRDAGMGEEGGGGAGVATSGSRDGAVVVL